MLIVSMLQQVRGRFSYLQLVSSPADLINLQQANGSPVAASPPPACSDGGVGPLGTTDQPQSPGDPHRRICLSPTPPTASSGQVSVI